MTGNDAIVVITRDKERGWILRRSVVDRDPNVVEG
jgi:hypothetical protein